MRLARRLAWPAVLVLLLAAASCRLEREERRELTAPLGPSAASTQEGTGVSPGPVMPPMPPEPRLLIRSSVGTGAGLGAAAAAAENANLHFDAIVIDTHVDTPQTMLDGDFDILRRNEHGHLDLPRMREGGLDAAFFAVWVDPHEYERDAAYDRALDLFGAVHEVSWESNEVVLADRTDELRWAVSREDVALFLGVEGAHALGTRNQAEVIRRLRTFRALGARYMTITWSTDNAFGHSSTGEHPERGLTDLGRRLIAEMEAIGMVVDVSHASDQTFWDIMDVATRPVIASHSSVRAIADHPRNLTDEMILRIAETGGAVCVNYFTLYVDREYAAARRRIIDDHRSEFRPLEHLEIGYTERGAAYLEVAQRIDPELQPPSIGVIVDHIMHIVDLAGPDAACLGSDFDGVSELPVGLSDASDLPALTRRLRARGLPDHHVVKILGGNVIRVLRAGEPRASGRDGADDGRRERRSEDSTEVDAGGGEPPH